ncbi:MAG: hypothetical protein OEV55_05855 [candidate division Zixibacteria bacterium]|nr:hypothetical protein [candidate division Zixibacteria bacterium]
MRSIRKASRNSARGIFIILISCFCLYIPLYTSGSNDQNVGEKSGIVNTDSGTIIKSGELVFHQPVEDGGYNWFTYVPKSINKKEINYIWITGLHGNFVTDDYDTITNESREQAQSRMEWAEKHRLIMCVPVIPRPRTNYVYTVAFPTEVFLKNTDKFCQRSDLKVNMMVDEFTNRLRKEGYRVSDRILIDGFSAGAMFAQRYALLHPDRVLAIAIGQCGGAMTLPSETYDTTKLNWPVGVNDFLPLTGNQFDFNSYKEIAQFVYIGEMDSTNSTLAHIGELWHSEGQIEFLKKSFGNTDPIRIANQSKYLKDLGCNITFKINPGIGHRITKEIFESIFIFFNEVITEHQSLIKE